MRSRDLIDERLQRYLAAALARSDAELRERVRIESAVFRDAIEGFIRGRRERSGGSA
jgi:hypothetical protein